jgi:hypothetical protein
VKRFRDTGIWEKPWFRKLGLAEKAGWAFICDRCDNVGVWVPDLEAAEFFIGGKVDWEGLKNECNGNIEVLPDGKWWLMDFCLFQHGDLFERKPSSVVNSHLSLLEKHGLTERVRQLFANCSSTVKGKGKGLGLGKGEGKGEERVPFAEGVCMTKTEHSALVRQYGERVVGLAVQKVSAQQIKTGKPYKSPRGAILQWGIRAALEEIKKAPVVREAPAAPLCPKCGGALERDHGYWTCKTDGRQEDAGA